MAVGVRPFTDRIEVLGAAKGRQSVTITSNTAELITAVHFTDGQAVSRGQVLVELKAEQEDAGILEAKARLAQAERDYTRWKTLADKGIAPAPPPSSTCRPSRPPRPSSARPRPRSWTA
jgi:membrane fusion protein (multidrug efflux system)